MTDIAEVLATYDYAETVELTVAEGKITVELAEAHPIRNAAWTLLVWGLLKTHKLDNHHELPEDEKIKVLCAVLLKRWDVTKDGKPLDPKDAAPFFMGSRAGRLLFREIYSICLTPARFHRDDTKKKPSSTSTPNGSSSERRPKRSPSKPTPKAGKSPKGSATTSTG